MIEIWFQFRIGKVPEPQPEEHDSQVDSLVVRQDQPRYVGFQREDD